MEKNNVFGFSKQNLAAGNAFVSEEGGEYTVSKEQINPASSLSMA